MKKSKATIKAEKEAEAIQRARIEAALRWTDDSDIAPDVPPPTWGQELTTGWVLNTYYRRIEVACSSSSSHAIGQTDKTTSQRPLALYSTSERALRALRVILEREFATVLAKIDAQLEEIT